MLNFCDCHAMDSQFVAIIQQNVLKQFPPIDKPWFSTFQSNGRAGTLLESRQAWRSCSSPLFSITFFISLFKKKLFSIQIFQSNGRAAPTEEQATVESCSSPLFSTITIISSVLSVSEIQIILSSRIHCDSHRSVFMTL